MPIFESNYLILGGGLVVLLAFFCVFTLFKKTSKLALQKKSKILSVSQKNFFDVLLNSLGREFHIFARVGFKEVIELSSEVSRWQRKKSLEVIENNVFDFVLVNPTTMSIYAVIELQDFGPDNNLIHKVREKMLNRICESANLKLFYFNVREDYKRKDIARLITGKARKVDQPTVDHSSVLELQSRSYSVEGDVRMCPKCRSELVTKVATKGSRIGEKFHLCRKYPYCDFRIAADDSHTLQSFDSAQLKKKEGDQKVYNNW